jgi:CPA2 family monovalent cation:H+ antiporter-2
LTSEAGLSLALGAFLAGLIISESEYSHQATSVILPFRELFTSFFFISVGMLLDLTFFANNYLLILLLVLVVFFAKSIITGFAVAVLKYPPKTVILTALSLFQVGEFAFILSKVGIEYNLLSKTLNQYFLAVSITTMVLTPIVMMFSHSISNWLKNTLLARPFDPQKRLEKELNSTMENEMENHLVIIGYGINGSNVAKAAKYSKIPHKVIELDAEKVRREQAKGTPIIFGDASHPHILNQLNLYKARAVVVAVSDMETTRRIISAIRSISQSVYMLVRTRYVKEMSELRALGADEVIPEEFETSIELFSKVLHNFLIPEDDIAEFVKTVRSDNYELFQDEKRRPRTFRPSKFRDFNITCLKVNRESGKVLDTPFKQLDLRRKYGINILSIYRNDELLENPKPTEVIKRGDQLFVHGKPQSIDKFHKMLN